MKKGRPRIGNRTRRGLQDVIRWAEREVASAGVHAVMTKAERADVHRAIGWLRWQVEHRANGKALEVPPRSRPPKRRRGPHPQLAMTLDETAGGT